ncbi:transposase [Heliobacterium chlorum]|uniref:Transposase n=1 Tax=Heliobacterium chlorum TaxID=2698 RepID=A0ABR7T112_HELCL|nr:transposase [Heliobacterium chlorum]MBC9783802.1 transposase [Heliobacterium chlorum]
MITMAQYYDIQRMHFRECKSKRTIAKELKISRRTVKKYLTEGKKPLRPPTWRSIKLRPAPVIEEVRPLIEKWIREEESAPVKQRHTRKRIFERLVTEHCFTGAESTVRKEVGRIRNKIKEDYLPLEFQLGDNIQCDWGQAQITLNGTQKRFTFCHEHTQNYLQTRIYTTKAGYPPLAKRSNYFRISI